MPELVLVLVARARAHARSSARACIVFGQNIFSRFLCFSLWARIVPKSTICKGKV
jgi:hypothetical protein